MTPAEFWDALTVLKCEHRSFRAFAVLTEDVHGTDFTGRHDENGPVMEPVIMRAGQRVRIVMVSRLGDVGITPDLQAQLGYNARIPIRSLEDGSALDGVPLKDLELTAMPLAQSRRFTVEDDNIPTD